MATQLAFVGLGNMGGPMVRRLLAAGNAVRVADLRDTAVAEAVAAGAQAATSAAAAANNSEIVFLSLPAPADVRKVAADGGLLASTGPRVVVDLSTRGAVLSQELAKLAQDQGKLWVDAPVSGGVAGARNGTLAVMLACPNAVLPELQPLLANFGRVFHIGERAGMGQTMKLANNLLSAAAMAISSEAIVMGVKAGLDPAVMIDVINAGTGLNTATRDKFPRAILPRLFNFGFSSGLMTKDVRLCLAEAASQGMPMPIAEAILATWEAACVQLGADADFTEVVKVAERRAGVEVRKLL